MYQKHSKSKEKLSYKTNYHNIEKKVNNIMLEGGKYIIQQIVKTNARFKTRSYVAVSDKRDLVNFCLFVICSNQHFFHW